MALHILPSAVAFGSGPGQPGDHGNVLERARALWQAAQSGKPSLALKDKRIGLVCAPEARQEAEALRHAAAGIGAHVSDVRPGLGEDSSPSEVAATARMLGRLYDAVVLQGQARSVAARLADACSVPVLDGIASAGHPTALLAAELDPCVTPADARRFVIQAVLVGAMA